jgi:hypothetical protein
MVSIRETKQMVLPTTLKSSGCLILSECTSGTICIEVQRLQHTFRYYSRGTLKAACVSVVPSVCPCTICRRTYGGPSTCVLN